MAKRREKWYLYILRCSNDAFYTGITKNIENRLEMHNSGKGARYTRAHGPCRLVYSEECKSHREAMKRELQIKSWTRNRKERLIETV